MTTAYIVRADAAIGYNRLTARWEAIDVTKAVSDLFNTYHLLEVGIEALGAVYTFNPYLHSTSMKLYTGTLQEWFNANARVQFTDVTPGLPVLKFADGHWQSLYADTRGEAALVPPNTHTTQDFALDDASDIVIKLDDAYRGVYSSSVLYAVDGQWVHSVMDIEGVRLKGAGNIARRSRRSTIGGLVFGGIGAVKTVPIASCTLVKLVDELGWYSTLLLGANTSLTGKSVGIVVAGVLTWLPASAIISDQAISFSFRNYDLAKNIYELDRYYDWTAIGLDSTDVPLLVTRLTSGETLNALFNHESSFLVVVDNPHLEITSVAVDCASVPGVYYLDDPLDPDAKQQLGVMVNDYGKAVDYWPTFEEGKWTFHTTNFEQKNWLMNQNLWKKQRLVSAAQPIVDEPWRERSVRMLRYRARAK